MITRSDTSFTIPKPRNVAGEISIYRQPGSTQAMLVEVTDIYPLNDCGLRIALTDPVTPNDQPVFEYELAGLDSDHPLSVAARFVEELATDPRLALHARPFKQRTAKLTGPIEIELEPMDGGDWETTWGVRVDGKLVASAAGLCHVTAFKKLVRILRQQAARHSSS
ncbi:hypothetical protein [Poriferisphaera sp. WC338]|uniref:hypothetical protein n=1 Tax=Poriferisphaera sp. WC338 TaxID=3425129 RepID=UPI003D81850A